MLKFYERVKRPWVPIPNTGASNVGSSNDPNNEVGNDPDEIVELSNKKNRVEECAELSDADIIVDPSLRKSIEEYDPRIRDEVRRRYILKGPCQPLLDNYPMSAFDNKNRQFQKQWFIKYPWLEYSESMDAVFCFYCYLFKGDKEPTKFGDEVYTKKGFRNWKKASERFKEHVGAAGSFHNACQTQFFSYKDQRQSIRHTVATGTTKIDEAYRTRLTASLDVSRLLLRNGLPFRGNDESEYSIYKGNFLDFLEWYSERVPEIARVVLKNAPRNCQLTSPKIQKDIVSSCAARVRTIIMNEVGERVFSILIDGARDSSVKEQIAFVLRYVNDSGEAIERFVGVVHVSDTSAKTLKAAVDNFLMKHKLSLSRVRGQGYDGASNMRGELNGLKALILNENKCAWYVHCFAHQLQLVVVSVAEQIRPVRSFFEYASMVVNMVGASCKRHDALKQKQHDQMVQRLEKGEISTGTGLNQEKGLARPGETRWGSHYKTIIRILSMYSVVLDVLQDIYNDGVCSKDQSKVMGLYDKMMSYEFVFIAHLMKEILGMTSELSFFLQQKDQNIVADIGLIDTTKMRFQQLRNDGWEKLLEEVNSFCGNNNISITNLEDNVPCRLRSQNAPTYYHYYHVEIFCQVIDSILTEMNHRFTEANSELLMCISCLDPRNSFSKFDHSRLLRLAELYPEDFSASNIMELKDQLETFIIEVRRNDSFVNLDGIGSLAKKMVELDFQRAFHWVYRLIELALVLPVATASVERAFSAMSIIKTDLRNRMGDDYLDDSMVCYVEKEIFLKVENEVVIDHFQNMRTRRNVLPPLSIKNSYFYNCTM